MDNTTTLFLGLAIAAGCFMLSCSGSSEVPQAGDTAPQPSGATPAPVDEEAARAAIEALRVETRAELEAAPIADVVDAALTGHNLRSRLARDIVVERLEEAAAEALARLSTTLASLDIGERQELLEFNSPEATLFRLLGSLAADPGVTEELVRLAASEQTPGAVRKAAASALAQSGAASHVGFLFQLADAGTVTEWDLQRGAKAAVQAGRAEPAFRKAFFDRAAAAEQPSFSFMATVEPDRFLEEVASVEALRASDRDRVDRIFVGLANADLPAGHDATLDTLRRFRGDRPEGDRRLGPLAYALRSAASHDSPELRAIVLELTDHPNAHLAAKAAYALAQIHGVSGSPVPVSPSEPLGAERHQHIATGFDDLFMGSNYIGFSQSLDRSDGLDPFPNMILAAKQTGIDDLVDLVEDFHRFMRRSDGLHRDPEKRAGFWEAFLDLDDDDRFVERLYDFEGGIFEYFPQMERAYYLYLIEHRDVFLRDRAELEASLQARLEAEREAASGEDAPGAE